MPTTDCGLRRSISATMDPGAFLAEGLTAGAAISTGEGQISRSGRFSDH